MTMHEIETCILKEFDLFFPSIKALPFDVALPILQRKLWMLADQYGIEGEDAFNIVMKRIDELKNNNK